MVLRSRLTAGRGFKIGVVSFWAFLYRASSFFLSLSMSFRLALLMIVEKALWHREGMSYMFGVSGSWRMVVACVVGWGCLVFRSVSVGCVCVLVVLLFYSC